MTMKRRLASTIFGTALIGTLTLGGVGSALAQDADVTTTTVSRNGAVGLVAAVVTAQDLIDVNNSTIDIAVVELNNSLNNLRALNNVLNNNDVDITIQDIDVLTGAQIAILEDATIVLSDVVGVAILDGGDFIVFT